MGASIVVELRSVHELMSGRERGKKNKLPLEDRSSAADGNAQESSALLSATGGNIDPVWNELVVSGIQARAVCAAIAVAARTLRRCACHGHVGRPTRSKPTPTACRRSLAEDRAPRG